MRKYREMGVKYLITTNASPDGFLSKGFLLCMCNLARYFKVRSEFWYIPNPAVMFLWNNERMTHRVWVNVHEGQECLVFIDNLGRNFFGDDFAEDTVFHG